jgi:hypothetical protein
MPFGYIYKILFPNGKHYIGLTTSVEKRKQTHKCMANNGDTKCLLYKALRKYNMIETFELIVIDTADNGEELCEKETSYIHFYNSYYVNGYGYNMTYGGEGFNGYKFTEGDKLKMSESRKKYIRETPGAIERMSDVAKQAHINNPELRNIQAATREKNYQENPQVRQNMSDGQKIRMENNPEVREHLAEQSRQFWNGNDEAKKRMSELKKEQCNDLEWKKKCSDRMKQRHIDNPEAGKQHGIKMQQLYNNNPEKRELMSDKKKQYHIDNPEAGKQHGENLSQMYIDNPELRVKCSESQKKRFERPEEREKLSKIHTQRFIDNPNARINKNMPYKPFNVYDKKTNELIGSYDYKFQAVDDIKKRFDTILYVGNIHKLLEGRGKSAKGMTFKYN